ncbi:hypothetical protein [Aeromonas sp. CA23]|uniref:hypothetical protein n=1 Tax=Aeromonas sp. CA23 TaxID=2033032 RepID=UPI0012FDF96C|nr:hypothetical protein [Aeromonas sp. CA23]
MTGSALILAGHCRRMHFVSQAVVKQNIPKWHVFYYLNSFFEGYGSAYTGSSFTVSGLHLPGPRLAECLPDPSCCGVLVFCMKASIAGQDIPCAYYS